MAAPVSHWQRHRGWLVVLGAFLVMLVGFGAIYSSSAFAPEIAASLGLQRGDAAMVLALSSSVTFFVSAISGPLSDRVGPRPLAVFGTLLIALGLGIAAAATDAASFFASYGLLVGIGVGLAYVPAVATVQRWFLANRGLASGIALSGIGVGTALIPLIKLILADFGDWRFAFLICAGLAALVGLAGALLLEARPEAHGLGPDGTRLRTRQAAPKPEGLELREALRSPAFLLAYAGTLLVAIPAAAPLMLLVGTAEARGLSHPQAVALLGLMGVGTIIGRFCLAALADLLGRRLGFLLSCLGVSVAMMLWALAEGATSLQGFALIYGALQGGFVALLPAFVADSFGSRSVGGLVGLLYTSRGIALLAGVPLVSLGVSALGAHDLPVAVCGLIGMLGTLLLAMARPAPRKGKPHPKAEPPQTETAITQLEPARLLRRKSAVLAMQRAGHHGN
ncbi:MAG: MFS transporter [Roseomonas sp.]|nr:MFS transporter [Roseomonas sp.]